MIQQKSKVMRVGPKTILLMAIVSVLLPIPSWGKTTIINSCELLSRADALIGKEIEVEVGLSYWAGLGWVVNPVECVSKKNSVTVQLIHTKELDANAIGGLAKFESYLGSAGGASPSCSACPLYTIRKLRAVGVIETRDKEVVTTPSPDYLLRLTVVKRIEVRKRYQDPLNSSSSNREH